MYQPIPDKTLWEEKLLCCPETGLEEAERMANALAGSGGSVPQLQAERGSCCWQLPSALASVVSHAGLWRGCQVAVPSTTSVVLFVMVVVLRGVNWVNERIVHY